MLPVAGMPTWSGLGVETQKIDLIWKAFFLNFSILIPNHVIMCGRYIEVQKVEAIEKRFNVKAPEGLDYQPGYNISPGQKAPVITNERPDELQMFQFGLTPFWSKKPMYLFNAQIGRASCRERVCHRV